MAASPVHLLEAGLVTEQRFAALVGGPAALGSAMVETLKPAKHVRIAFNHRDRWLTAARETCRDLSDAVCASLRSGALPVICGGECTLVAGSIQGALQVEPDLLLVYLDAHGDFNTLATTPTHFVGGMCLAHVCGKQVAALLWPGVKKMPEEQVILVGGRELDPGEAGNLSRSHVGRVPFDAGHPDAPGLLALVRRRPVWIHVDLDVVDPRELGAVVTPVEGGPPLSALETLLAQIASVSDVRGIELCGYDPSKDAGSMLPGALARTVSAALA
ncbi:MAG: arginase family protein [Chloroflexi bacterium]|nr:arginase family protein [Chloroflexota bacterium]